MSSEIYSVKPAPHPGAYTFTKFDNDLSPLTSYLVSDGECNCPRGTQGKDCRHRDMLRGFIKTNHVGDGWMFNYSTRQWITPPRAIREAVEEVAASHDSAASAPAPEPQVLASAPASPTVNGAGVTTFRKRRLV